MERVLLNGKPAAPLHPPNWDNAGRDATVSLTPSGVRCQLVLTHAAIRLSRSSLGVYGARYPVARQGAGDAKATNFRTGNGAGITFKASYVRRR